jgi:hypothetical protein
MPVSKSHSWKEFKLIRSAALGHDKAQNIIDQITAAYESGSGPPPGGFGYGAPLPGFGGRE